MRVAEVHFNHSNYDPTSAPTGAFTIQDSSGRVITAPEWRDGRSDPAAYALKVIRSGVTIKARFSGGRPNDTSQIRAVPASGRSLQWGLDYAGAMRRGAAPRNVTFDSNGESELESFEIKIPPDSTVGVSDLMWNWQMDQSGRWVDVATTHHRIYFTADLPNPPWSRVYELVLPFPLIEAIGIACTWAAGATTVAESTARIVKAINSLPNQYYEATSVYVDLMPADAPFNLPAFLMDLGSASFHNECRGVAAVVVTFANMLGDTLCPLSIRAPMGSFQTRSILLLNSTTPEFTSFGRHEVGADQGVPVDDHIPVYDACLRFDGMPPVLAIRMPVGKADPGGFDYRQKLIADNQAATTFSVIPPRNVLVT
jgi:hypothetical protein